MFSQNNFFVTKNYKLKEDIYNEYVNYSNYVSKLLLTNNTLEWRLKHIRDFLHYLSCNNIKLKDLKITNIYDYMQTLEKKSLKTREHRAVCIRLFLNYLYSKKITNFDGKDVFPKIKCYKESSTISYYSKDEIIALINSVDIKEKNGKRDFIILLLFSKLGLRLNDVRKLRLDEISWKDNTIKIVQSKNNWINVLPFDNDIRYALIEYIKYERSISNLPYVFLKDENSIYNYHLFYDVVNKYFIKAKIDTQNKRHGPHSLRHSLGTSLMNDNNSIYEISNILGHSCVEDTKPYIKTNINELKKISLEVPTWKN